MNDGNRRAEIADGPAKTLQIILMEDSPSDARLFQEAIKRWRVPVQTTVADDGYKGIELLKHWNGPVPDLVLINIILPKIGGFDVLRWIRTQPKLEGVQAIVMSSSALHQDLANALANGATYMRKGNNFDECCDRVDDMQRKFLARSGR